MKITRILNFGETRVGQLTEQRVTADQADVRESFARIRQIRADSPFRLLTYPRKSGKESQATDNESDPELRQTSLLTSTPAR